MKKRSLLIFLSFFIATISFANIKNDILVNALLNKIISGLVTTNIASLEALNLQELDKEISALQKTIVSDDPANECLQHLYIPVREGIWVLGETSWDKAYRKKKARTVAVELREHAEQSKLHLVKSRGISPAFRKLYQTAAEQLRSEHKDSLAIYEKLVKEKSAAFEKRKSEHVDKLVQDVSNQLAGKSNMAVSNSSENPDDVFGKLSADYYKNENAYNRQAIIKILTDPDMPEGDFYLMLSRWNEGKFTVLNYVAMQTAAGTNEKKLVKILKKSMDNFASQLVENRSAAMVEAWDEQFDDEKTIIMRN